MPALINSPVGIVREWLARSPLIDALGWTLVHSLWQGVAVAVLLAIVLPLMRGRTASARYIVAITALMILPLSAGITFGLLNRQALPPMVQQADSVPVASARLPMAAPISPVRQIDPTPLTSEQKLRAMLPFLVVAWGVGVVFIGIYHLGGWVVVRRLRHSGTAVDDACAVATFHELIDRLSISRPVTLTRCMLVQVPTVIGWLRPVILLPINALTGLTSDQLRGLLAHELAHVRRCDYLVNIVQTIVETLLFYHPAVWWMGRVIRQERENACDDLAAAVCDRATYAQALASMEKLRQAPSPALGAKGGALLPRIRRILGAPDDPRRRRLTSSLAAGSIGAAIVVLLFVVSACSNNNTTSADKGTDELANAESVKPADLVATVSDYRIGKNDLLSVSIMDLQALGTETVKQARVNESGMISLPLVGQVNVSGMTEAEAEKAVAATYVKAGYLANAQVSVTVAEARSRTYSILGAVKLPGQYAMTKSDYRLLDALACAGGETLDVKELFVVRKIPGKDKPRIIKVPLEPLHAMDLKYNLVIQPDDMLILRPPQTSVAAGASTKLSTPTTSTARRKESPGEYRILRGDVLLVNLNDLNAKREPAEVKVFVAENGTITFPPVEDLPAEGKTTPELAADIANIYLTKKVSPAPIAKVTVLETAADAPRPYLATQPAIQAITADDLRGEKSDYKLAPDDKVSISIWDLTANGVETKREASITDSGNISMPYVGNVKIAGKTIVDAEKAIAKAYESAALIRNANVMLTLLEARSRSFSILFSQNTAGQSGQYTLPTSDFRLLDALAISKAELQSIASIKVMRAGEKEARVLQIASEGLLAGDANLNVVIRPKDTLIVQTRQTTAEDRRAQSEGTVRRLMLESLEKELAAAKMKLADNKSRYNSGHPAVIAAQRHVDVLTQQIKQEREGAAGELPTAQTTTPSAAAPAVDAENIEHMQAELDRTIRGLAATYARLGPNHPRVLQAQTQIERLRRQLEQAAADAASGSTQNPTTAPADLEEQTAKGQQLFKAALEAEKGGDFAQAVRCYEAMKQLHPLALPIKSKTLDNYLQWAKDHLPPSAKPAAVTTPPSTAPSTLAFTTDLSKFNPESPQSQIELNIANQAMKEYLDKSQADLERQYTEVLTQAKAKDAEAKAYRLKNNTAEALAAEKERVALLAKAAELQGQLIKPFDIPNTTAAHFVRLVVGTDRMTFQGEPVTWETLKAKLEQVPDRSNTALELAVASDDVTIGQINKARSTASGLVHELGFKYLTEVGQHPIGSTPGDESPTTKPAAAAPFTQGEYYVGGHVPRVGVYSLTGRKIRLTQAIAAAGGFDDPKMGDDTQIRVVHRKDGKEEVEHFVWSDLKKPDADPALRPDDVIEVGTEPKTPATQPATQPANK